MRAREFLQLLGLGPGIKFYPFVITDALGKTVNWVKWLVPKKAPDPDFDSELTLYTRFLKPGDWAIDIGAHIGDTSMGPAAACGVEGGVLAFEPNPTTFHILSLNAALNKKSLNIIPLPLAAGDEYKHLQFDYGDHWCSNGGFHDVSKWKHGGAYVVHVYQVDTLGYLNEHFSEEIKRVRYIKVDAEAMDWVILDNLESLIIQNRPILQLEIGETEAGQLRGLEYLSSLQYKAFMVRDNQIIQPFQSYMPRKGSFDVIAAPDDDPLIEVVQQMIVDTGGERAPADS